jgi:hypothetical protein
MQLADGHEMLDGFFAFMDSAFCKCPYCGEPVSKDEWEENCDKIKGIVICPSCEEEFPVGELTES